MEPVAFLCVFVCVLEGNSDRYVRVSNGTPPTPAPVHSDSFYSFQTQNTMSTEAR